MDTKSTGSQPSGTSLRKQAFGVLALGALGVVFGDIGTSPLYAFKDCFSGHYSLPMTRENIIGILSLITWSLFMVITFKYICFVLRADNNGQGGTFAMLALLRKTIKDPKKAGIIGTLAIMGAAPLYAESIITPAISVLSAMEGISVYTDKLNHFIIPSTLVILFLLFMMQ
ncbi:MAG: KUP/HAK/KT family potassium transporter, partial [Candidatus Sumerlaeales bacterium]|nr:KUP/HAK/KT family potassium transporter [Candidatus Sumerlaeales bacterium]